MYRISTIAGCVIVALSVGLAQPTIAAPAANQTTSVAIPAMPLKQALNEFAQREHLQFVYVSQIAEGVRTRGAAAGLSTEATLQALLRGTGLGFRFLNANTVTIFSTEPRSGTAPQPSSAPSSSLPKPPPKQLQTVTVTGSLIPQSQIETANPVIKLSAQQMERAGFGNIYQALRSLPLATGAVQDNQYAGGFTNGSETISLLGLQPGFTLFLINGHPMTSNPLLYDGTSNFVDISDIPIGMVDRVEILPGNQSSIYGSSAIAGVVNIILKDHINGYELNVRGGGYSQGGGTNERIEFLGGYDSDKLKMTYGMQFENQKPIFGYQRDLNASTLANPDPGGRSATPTFVNQIYDLSSGYLVYTDPGATACSGVSSLYKGTTGRDSTPNGGPPFDPTTGAPVGPGYYCGTPYQGGYATMLNQAKFETGYLNVNFRLNEHAELYANILYNVSSQRFTFGPYFWVTSLDSGGIFYNPDSGQIQSMYHVFAPEEIGDWKFSSTHNLQRTYNAWFGVRGDVGDWNYDAYFARSQQNLVQKEYFPLTDAVDAFFQKQFLGPLLGTTDGLPEYVPNYSDFYKPLTPAQYASFLGLISNHNSTWTQNLNLKVVNANLFQLPAGAAALAGVFQYGEETWKNPTDPGVINGDYYGLTGTSGAGARNHWAYTAELQVPILKTLLADVSARYDHYANHGGGAYGHLTYKLGLEFRPFDTLLLRANYGTAFRAPDMSYVFGGTSGIYQYGLTDYYRCDQYGGPLDQCPYYQTLAAYALHSGNPELKPITAKSYGGGMVWSPNGNLTLKADYYNVSIKNEVELQSTDQLLKQEAACRTGELPIDSSTCQVALAQVTRPPGSEASNLVDVQLYPINIANERVSGIIASGDYRIDMGRFGSLGLQAQYNVTLKHVFQQYPFDPVVDYLRDPFYSSEFKNIASASVTWNVGRWSSTLRGTRYGRTPNYYAQSSTAGYATPCITSDDGYRTCPGTVAPWMVYNASVTYDIADGLRISGIVNNVFDSSPPFDYTWTESPYYNRFNYNTYGRQYWIELDWKFGRR